MLAITGFKHGGLKRFHRKHDASKLPKQYLNRIENILLVLDSGNPLGNLAIPGYRLHPMKGDRKGVWSVTVTGNWRITFRVDRGDAYDVDLVDYHRK